MGELAPWQGGGGGGGEVASVFGRKGAVVAEPGDYTVAEVTGASSVAQLNEEAAARHTADEALEALIDGPAGGDLAGNYPNPTIRAALKALIEGALQPGAAAGGDLAGTYPNPTIRAALKALIEGAIQAGAAAGGDLAGAYPNPTIGALKVTGAKVAAATLADSKLEKPVISGVVKVNGEKESGEGFTSERLAAGEYKIVLANELPTLGAMTVNSLEAALVPDVTAAKKIFLVKLYSTNVVLTDGKFSFQVKAS